jgi:hypothetical protein
MNTKRVLLLSAMLSLAVCTEVFSQRASNNPAGNTFGRAANLADSRPGLLFREDFKEGPLAQPLAPDEVSNPNLTFSLYGPGKDTLRKSHHDTPKDDPFYIFTGSCTAHCAMTLRDKQNLLDLSGYSKVRWRTKQSGFHQLRVILKLADGKWLISESAVGPSEDWQITDFVLYGARWLSFDPNLILELTSPAVEHPDLSRVDEIGFTDLSIGNGLASGGASRIDWIEVYGRAIKR